MKYPQGTLGELCNIVIGRTPSRSEPSYWGKGNKWISISDLNGKIVSDSKEEITDQAVIAARCRRIEQGTLLFSFKLTIGKMAFAGCDLFTNEAIAALEIKNRKRVSGDYLYYALRSAKFGGSNQAAKGKTLNSKSLAEISLPLPPFDDQLRIAYLLSKVEGLIEQRRQHLRQVNDLLKALFLEMFSPKRSGYQTWPLVQIRDLAEKHKSAMRTGPFGSNLLHSEFTTEGDVAVLGIDNAVQNRFAWGERRFISKEKYQELESYRIYPGDVIITIMGTIGRSAVIPEDIPLAINTKHLAAITLNRKVANPVFLSYSIHSSPFVLNQFRSKNRGAIMSGLNLGIIRETKLKLPPIELQNQFAELHTSIDALESRLKQSLSELEALYRALSQQAMKGEIDLSRVPLQDAAQQESLRAVSTKVMLPTMKPKAIDLPRLDVQPDALESLDGRRHLLEHWLEDYRRQLDGAPFSMQAFMAAAQALLAELHPNADSEISGSDYDHLKDWVFAALADGRLVQGYDDKDNCLQLLNTAVVN